jgi:lipoprotein NlpD
MSERIGSTASVGKGGVIWNSLAVAWLALLTACSYHPPAPIEEHSSTMVKRQLSSDGTYYVRKGDTLYAIAFSYGLDFREVAEWNNIPSPYTIYPGQELKLVSPGRQGKGRTTPGVQTKAVKTPGPITTADVENQPSPPAANTVSAKTAPVTSPADPTGEKKTRTVPAPVKTGTTAEPNRWQWPARGRLLRTYVAGNPARNGLDIAGKEGQAIKATAGGQVVYSGNGLIGYGELIIIKHSDKMLSAYAHNKVRLVSENDRVEAGQKIAEMGRNSSNEEVLHFEIRVNGKPVNPLTYLPRQ